MDGRHTTFLFVAYDALNAAEDMPEVGEVYKVMKSIDGTYITEIQHVDTWSVVESVTNSALWVEDQHQNEDKYVTNGDTIYVMVEEQYDANRDGWVTDLERTFDVSEVTYRDIQEDLEREDNYITLAQVVKTDDGIAELVYIWRFVPLTVNVDDDNDGVADYTEYVRTWWNDVNDPVTIGYEAPANYTIDKAEVSNVWGATKSVLVGDKIVIDVDELLPYIEYRWDNDFENVEIFLDVNVTLTADKATVTVENADKLTVTGSTIIDTEDGTELTISAGDKYNVTGVTCEPNKGIQISESNGVYTVVIPAGTEDVTIGTTVEEKVYNVSYADTWQDGRDLILTKAPTTIGADSAIEIEITTTWEGSTRYNLDVISNNATGTFTKVDGVAQETDSATPISEADFKALQGTYKTLYTDADCTQIATSYQADQQVYWITVEGKAPVWTGTITEATGDVEIGFTWG